MIHAILLFWLKREREKNSKSSNAQSPFLCSEIDLCLSILRPQQYYTVIHTHTSGAHHQQYQFKTERHTYNWLKMGTREDKYSMRSWKTDEEKAKSEVVEEEEEHALSLTKKTKKKWNDFIWYAHVHQIHRLNTCNVLLQQQQQHQPYNDRVVCV